MTPALKDLLFVICQHSAYQEFLRAVPCPEPPRFKKSENLSVEQIGAKFLISSGELEQHERWISFLTGSPKLGDNNPV